jgi:hypothetical protein
MMNLSLDKQQKAVQTEIELAKQNILGIQSLKQAAEEKIKVYDQDIGKLEGKIDRLQSILADFDRAASSAAQELVNINTPTVPMPGCARVLALNERPPVPQFDTLAESSAPAAPAAPAAPEPVVASESAPDAPFETLKPRAPKRTATTPEVRAASCKWMQSGEQGRIKYLTTLFTILGNRNARKKTYFAANDATMWSLTFLCFAWSKLAANRQHKLIQALNEYTAWMGRPYKVAPPTGLIRLRHLDRLELGIKLTESEGSYFITVQPEAKKFGLSAFVQAGFVLHTPLANTDKLLGDNFVPKHCINAYAASRGLPEGWQPRMGECIAVVDYYWELLDLIPPKHAPLGQKTMLPAAK